MNRKKLHTDRFWLLLPAIMMFPFFSIMMNSCHKQQAHLPYAQEGIIDISHQPFNTFKRIQLNGEWEYYPGELINPEAFDTLDHTHIRYQKVPGLWPHPLFRNNKQTLSEYATYRLRIIGQDIPHVVGLQLGEILSASRLFINGRPALNNGRVSKEVQTARPGYDPGIRIVLADSDTLTLVLQVSNFHHAKGGIFGSITIGPSQQMQQRSMLNTGFDFFLIGSLLIMALYHFGLFFFRRNELSPLYLGLFMLTIMLRIMVTGQETLLLMAPQLSWHISYKIEYLTFYSAPAFFLFFFRCLYPNRVQKTLFYGILAIILAFIALILLSPVMIFSKSILFYQFFVLGVALIIIRWLWSARKRDMEGATIFLVGGLFVFLTLINDILYSSGHFRTTELSAAGIFIFILCQSYVLSLKHAKTYFQNQLLSQKLDLQKKNLKREVQKRTEEIEQQKEELQAQATLMEKTNLELESQKTDLEQQGQAMEIINQMLEQEKRKSDTLLKSMLPETIARELREHGKVKAHTYPAATVVFVDFVSFTRIAEILTPEELVLELDVCFSAFDDIIDRYKLEKIKTIGDAYMFAGGLTETPQKEACAAVLASMEIQQFMIAYSQAKKLVKQPYFNCRIGVHTGPVVASVVGKSRFVFDIWGAAVNTAKGLEAACENSRVNISADTHKLVKDYFTFAYRGPIQLKHKSNLEMFYVLGINDHWSNNGQGHLPSERLLREILSLE